jgi:hypothetical protein
MLDEKGADFLGMRLIVVLMAAFLLLSVASIYVEAYVEGTSRDQARGEAARIASLSDAEFASGVPGSSATISVTVPGCVRRIDFAGNIYAIEFDDGSSEVHAAGCPFVPATLYPGEHRLELTVISNGTYAVSMEAQDAR